METFGIGTEIVECPRIGRMIEQHGELFLTRVYTDREVRFCQSRKHAIEHFAGLWAAKEAILKAIGPAWASEVHRTDLEVRQSPGTGAKVHVRGGARDVAIRRGIGDILVSISHCRTYATAYAMVVGPGPARRSRVAEDAPPPPKDA